MSVPTRALIDTGAPRSIFPRGVGDLLAIHFPDFGSDAPKKIQLLGATWPTVTETVNLSLDPNDADVTWEAEVDFVLDEGLSFAILGDTGFLNRWAVTFNSAYGYFVIQSAEQQAREQDPALLDDLRDRYPGL